MAGHEIRRGTELKNCDKAILTVLTVEEGKAVIWNGGRTPYRVPIAYLQLECYTFCPERTEEEVLELEIALGLKEARN